MVTYAPTGSIFIFINIFYYSKLMEQLPKGILSKASAYFYFLMETAGKSRLKRKEYILMEEEGTSIITLFPVIG